MASYDEVVRKDLQLMWSILDECYRTPWINNFFSRVTSKHPAKDIVLVLWLFFFYGLVEIGVEHFWVATINLMVTLVARKIIEAKRPVEYDPRLQPTTDTGAESYGFPSVESFMSAVIMGHLALHFKSLVLLLLGLAVMFIVGFSRVYSKSRFPHQIVGSWFVGFIGLFLSMHCCNHMKFKSMKHFEHGVCVAIVIAGAIANIALNIENNDSRLLYVPKQEFVKVVSDIVSGGTRDAYEANSAVLATAIMEDDEDESDLVGSASYRFGRAGAGAESPRTAATRLAQDRRNGGGGMSETGQPTVRRRKKVKSDSLYFLQKSMEIRESNIKRELQQKNTLR